jgi:hypothetical protein
LFEKGPRHATEGEIKTAVDALAQRSPQLAKHLVQNYVRTMFDQHARLSLKTGADQYGGAGFAAAIRGNAQQRKNFETAMRSAYGDDITNGLNKYLDVLEATGMRQRIGSQTSFNTQLMKELGRPGASTESAIAAAFGTAGAAAGGPAGLALGAVFNLPQKAREAMTRMTLGKNMQSVADILSKPEQAAKFADLAHAANEPAQRSAIARLAIIADTAANRPKRVYVTGGHY